MGEEGGKPGWEMRREIRREMESVAQFVRSSCGKALSGVSPS